MTYSDTSGPALLLLRHGGHPGGLRTRPTRRWDRLGARLLARSLDRRLVAGEAPESHPRLATRAQTLVAPDQRRSLAAHWENLLSRARFDAPVPVLRRVPLCRERIAEAESSVREMLVALVAPVPVPAAGVARATMLLSDGSGPLYNRRSATDLITAVHQVTEELDPSVALVSSP